MLLVEITNPLNLSNVLNVTYVFSNASLATKSCQQIQVTSTEVNGNIEFEGFSWRDPQLDLSFYNSYNGLIYLDLHHFCNFHLLSSNYSDNATAYLSAVEGTWGNAININGSYHGQPSNSCCIPQSVLIYQNGTDLDELNVTYTFTQAMLNTTWCQQLYKNTTWVDVLHTDWAPSQLVAQRGMVMIITTLSTKPITMVLMCISNHL
jgi:hypothetical protein